MHLKNLKHLRGSDNQSRAKEADAITQEVITFAKLHENIHLSV